MIARSLGFFGFGLATLIQGLFIAGLFTFNAIALSNCVSAGGLLQFVAAVLAYQERDFISTFLFSAYSLFYLSWAFTLFLPLNESIIAPPVAAWGIFHFVWCIVSFCVVVLVWKPKSNWCIRFLFLSGGFVLFLLTIYDWTSWRFLRTTAGLLALFSGASAVYLSIAEALTLFYSPTVLPIGEIPAPSEPSSSERKATSPFYLPFIFFGISITCLISWTPVLFQESFAFSRLMVSSVFTAGFVYELLSGIMAFQHGDFRFAWMMIGFPFFKLLFVLSTLFIPIVPSAASDLFLPRGLIHLLWGIFSLTVLTAFYKSPSSRALRIMLSCFSISFLLFFFGDMDSLLFSGNWVGLFFFLGILAIIVAGIIAFAIFIFSAWQIVYPSFVPPFQVSGQDIITPQPLQGDSAGRYQAI